jgi:predicted transcriptional regulator YdeE
VILLRVNFSAIPAQTYTKFTNGPGPMPGVIRDAWFTIWDMSEEELGGARAYLTDFEIYDERAADHSQIVLDVCIGIK